MSEETRHYCSFDYVLITNMSQSLHESLEEIEVEGREGETVDRPFYRHSQSVTEIALDRILERLDLMNTETSERFDLSNIETKERLNRMSVESKERMEFYECRTERNE